MTIAAETATRELTLSQALNEALREEVLETVTEMIAVVNAQTDTPIWISGMGVPTEEP